MKMHLRLFCILLLLLIVSPSNLPSAVKVNQGADDIRWAVQAQIEAISYMVSVFYGRNKRLPRDFTELLNSRDGFLEITNVFTGAPINPIPYRPPSPTGQDSAERKYREEMGRIDLTGITSIPGELIYYPVKTPEREFYYLVIFTGDTSYEERTLEGTSTNYASHYTTRTERGYTPLDDAILRVGFFIEKVFPQIYNSYLFFSGQEVIPDKRWKEHTTEEILKMAEGLGIIILNPLNKQVLKDSETYSVGDIAATYPRSPQGEFYYYFSDRRVRRLRELYDREEFQRNLKDIQRRDKTAKG